MTSTGGSKHLNHTLNKVKTFDRVVTTMTYEGDQSDIEDYIDSISVGKQESKWGGRGLVTGISMRRKNGKVCEATVQYTKFLKKAIWGYDFRTLSKPTITFRFNEAEDDATVNQRAHRIRGWEALRDANRMPEYLEYKCIIYDDENEETGVVSLSDSSVDGCGPNTLSIAQKILRGQEVYNVYYPVITLTRTSDEPFIDDLDTIGKQCSPGFGGEWEAHGDVEQAKAVLGLKAIWVKTADNISTNTDGSFTRREQWTGMDDIDADFYPMA